MSAIFAPEITISLLKGFFTTAIKRLIKSPHRTFMKHIPAALLVAEAIYLAFVPVTIAHSIILFSLAGLFAFNQFLLSRLTPKLETEIAKLKSELEQQIEKQKELHEKQFSQLEGEVTKMSLNVIKTSSPSSSKEQKKYIF